MKIGTQLLVFCFVATLASTQLCGLASATERQWEKFIKQRMQPMNFSICKLSGDAQANYEKAVRDYSEAREKFTKTWAVGADRLNKRIGEKKALLAIDDYRVTAWNSLIDGNEALVTTLEKCRDIAPSIFSLSERLLLFLRIAAATNDFKRAEAFMPMLVELAERGSATIPADRQSFVWLYRIGLLQAYREQITSVRSAVEQTCGNSKDQEQGDLFRSMKLDETGYLEYLEKRSSPYPLGAAERISKLFNEYRAKLKQKQPEVDAFRWLRLCALYQLENDRPHQAMFYAYSARGHGSDIADEVILILLETIRPANGVLGSPLRDQLIATSKKNGALPYRTSLDRLGTKASIAKPRPGSWTGTSIAQGSLKTGEPAVLVSWVNPIGPGRSVLRAGMMIIRVGDERVEKPASFVQAVGSKPPGSVVELVVLDNAGEAIGNEKVIAVTTEGWPPSVMLNGKCDGSAEMPVKPQQFFLYSARDGIDPIDVELDRWERALKCKLTSTEVDRLRAVAATYISDATPATMENRDNRNQNCERAATILYCFNASSAFEKYFLKQPKDKSASGSGNKMSKIKGVFQPLDEGLQPSTSLDPVQKFAVRGMEEPVNFVLEGPSVVADVISFCSGADGSLPSAELSSRNTKLRDEVRAACR